MAQADRAADRAARRSARDQSQLRRQAPRRRLCARHSGPERGHARRPARRPRRGRRARSPPAPPRRSASSARPAAIAETFVDEGDARAPAAAGRPRRQARRRGAVRAGRRRADRAAADLGRDQAGDRPRPASASTADDAARLAFGAAARSWRYDVYRTKLGRKQKPTLEEVVIVGARRGRRRGMGARARRCSTASTSPATWSPSRPTSSIPRASSSAAARRLEGLGVEFEVLDEKAMAQARHGRPARRRPGLGAAAAAARHALERRRGEARSRSSSSARASPSIPAASRSSRRSAWKR